MIIHKDFDLTPLLWYKIGGKAKYVLDCQNKEDVIQALNFISQNNLKKIFVCGMGSNLIFTEEHFDGAVIRLLPNNPASITLDNDIIESFSGESLDSLIQSSFAHELSGLEWAGGLPGTVGAAVRGNVGAYGGEIKDSLLSCDVFDYSGDAPLLKTLTKEDLAFVYRGSLVKANKKMVVVTARFGLKKANDADIEAATDVYKKHIEQRKHNHPLEYPNCGSVFKNLRDKDKIEKVLTVYPEFREDVENKWYGKMAVAPLIEKLGLKGFRVGDAQVSEKHALFIVNLGQANAKDVLEVIETIQKKFQERFGFRLETEVEIVE